jgi:hypothetical protein
MKILASVVLSGWLAACLHAQTIDDGIMIGRRNLFAGSIYSYDHWDRYWQGSLNRVNGNVGTVTTQVNTLSANFGVTDRLNVIGLVPYVWTNASQGVLSGMQGFQDITLAAKYNAFERPFTSLGSIRVIGVVAGSIPLTDYEPDFQPLSIGNHSKRISGRLTLNFQSYRGWFINGSGAYTWRSDVTLDRPYYYTNDRFYPTDQVDMPGVFDYIASAGYLKRGLMTQFSFSQQRTQGGGDIRRQDAPFISNRMNYSRVGGMVMVAMPKLRDLSLQFAYSYAVQGRNVGQGSTFTGAMLYTVHFPGSAAHQ